MATTKNTEEIVESGVSEDMITAAQEDLKRLNEARVNPRLRTMKRLDSAGALYVSDLYALPETFDMDGIGPTSYMAQPEGEITGTVTTQTFSIREERLKGLLFEPPGRKLEQGRALRTVKAIKPNGELVQLAFEGQINNMAAGEVTDAIGIRFYQRKGFIILMDFDSLTPVYCFARNCHAAAMVPALADRYPQHTDVVGSGYCSHEHMVFTEPNLGRTGGSGFGVNATTSHSWERRQ